MGTGVSPKRIATGNILFSSSFLDLKTKQYIKPLLISLEGGDPAAPSDTATLLRLHPSYLPRLRQLLPFG